MTKSRAKKEDAVDDKLLTLPVNAGRAIVEAGAVIACLLPGTDRFIKFCRECGLSIFEAVVPLHVSAHEVETRIARLTEDQLRLIDVVEANPRVTCSGGAGTGKTMLALELAVLHLFIGGANDVASPTELLGSIVHYKKVT